MKRCTVCVLWSTDRNSLVFILITHPHLDLYLKEVLSAENEMFKSCNIEGF